jgi:hypothetical protein
VGGVELCDVTVDTTATWESMMTCTSCSEQTTWAGIFGPGLARDPLSLVIAIVSVLCNVSIGLV